MVDISNVLKGLLETDIGHRKPVSLQYEVETDTGRRTYDILFEDDYRCTIQIYDTKYGQQVTGKVRKPKCQKKK